MANDDWSPEQLDILVAMAQGGHTWAAIGDALGRIWSSCYEKYWAMFPPLKDKRRSLHLRDATINTTSSSTISFSSYATEPVRTSAAKRVHDLARVTAVLDHASRGWQSKLMQGYEPSDGEINARGQNEAARPPNEVGTGGKSKEYQLKVTEEDLQRRMRRKTARLFTMPRTRPKKFESSADQKQSLSRQSSRSQLSIDQSGFTQASREMSRAPGFEPPTGYYSTERTTIFGGDLASFPPERHDGGHERLRGLNSHQGPEAASVPATQDRVISTFADDTITDYEIRGLEEHISNNEKELARLRSELRQKRMKQIRDAADREIAEMDAQFASYD